MNIQAFAMIAAAYINPLAVAPTGAAEYAIWLVSHVFFDKKFITLFTMLFGAGHRSDDAAGGGCRQRRSFPALSAHVLVARDRAHPCLSDLVWRHSHGLCADRNGCRVHAPLVTASVGDRRSRAARRATGFVRTDRRWHHDGATRGDCGDRRRELAREQQPCARRDRGLYRRLR